MRVIHIWLLRVCRSCSKHMAAGDRVGKFIVVEWSCVLKYSCVDSAVIIPFVAVSISALFVDLLNMGCESHCLHNVLCYLG